VSEAERLEAVKLALAFGNDINIRSLEAIKQQVDKNTDGKKRDPKHDHIYSPAPT